MSGKVEITKSPRFRKPWTFWRFVKLSMLWLAVCFVCFSTAGVVVAYKTPFGNRMRILAAETIVSTRHYYLARYITSPAEYRHLLAQLDAPIIGTGIPSMVHVAALDHKKKKVVKKKKPVVVNNSVTITRIYGSGWNGFMVQIHNPKMIRLVKANINGAYGEYIDHMVPRVGGIIGINASGFDDPNGNGWGGIPEGLVMSGGKVINSPITSSGWGVAGFTKGGVFVMGEYSLAELRKLGVQDAMQFHPELIVNGKPMITSGDGGWGYDPRTAVGQEKDGTVVFVVINGRFHGGAGLGASMRQVQNLMLKYGVVNAMAMDGGSSSVLYDKGKILNSPTTIDPHGSRMLPDAWVVFPTVKAAESYKP